MFSPLSVGNQGQKESFMWDEIAAGMLQMLAVLLYQQLRHAWN
jgi:hypothetical protein